MLCYNSIVRRFSLCVSLFKNLKITNSFISSKTSTLKVNVLPKLSISSVLSLLLCFNSIFLMTRWFLGQGKKRRIWPLMKLMNPIRSFCLFLLTPFFLSMITEPITVDIYSFNLFFIKWKSPISFVMFLPDINANLILKLFLLTLFTPGSYILPVNVPLLNFLKPYSNPLNIN